MKTGSMDYECKGNECMIVQGISVRYNNISHMRRVYSRSCACRSVEGSRREFGECSVWMLKADYARHIKTSGVNEKRQQ